MHRLAQSTQQSLGTGRPCACAPVPDSDGRLPGNCGVFSAGGVASSSGAPRQSHAAKLEKSPGSPSARHAEKSIPREWPTCRPSVAGTLLYSLLWWFRRQTRIGGYPIPAVWL